LKVDIVGDGTETARLEALAAAIAPGLVTFHGPVYGSDLEPLVAASLATVLPSRQMEGTPYAVLQSFAWGRGVIATDVGALPEVIEDGVTGRIVPPGNPAALAEVLRTLHDAPSTAHGYGDAARARVLEDNDPGRYYRLLLRAYAEAGAEGVPIEFAETNDGSPRAQQP
jgi:glycosyltransferase involved in cell wall biosynthesis